MARVPLLRRARAGDHGLAREHSLGRQRLSLLALRGPGLARGRSVSFAHLPAPDTPIACTVDMAVPYRDREGIDPRACVGDRDRDEQKRPALRRAARSVREARRLDGDPAEVTTLPLGARQSKCPLPSGLIVQRAARAAWVRGRNSLGILKLYDMLHLSYAC